MAFLPSAFVCAILWCLLWYRLPSTSAECDDLVIKNTMYQDHLEGSYVRHEDDCNYRASYVQQDVSEDEEPYYIYYVWSPTIYGWQGWMVGSTWCTRKGGMAAADEALFPDEVRADWEKVFDDEWQNSPNAFVGCPGPSPAVIGGAVAGALVVVVVIIIVIACCCCCQKAKNNSQETTGHRDNPVPSISQAGVGVHYDNTGGIHDSSVRLNPHVHVESRPVAFHGQEPGTSTYHSHLAPQAAPPYNITSQQCGHLHYEPPPAYSEVVREGSAALPDMLNAHSSSHMVPKVASAPSLDPTPEDSLKSEQRERGED